MGILNATAAIPPKSVNKCGVTIIGLLLSFGSANAALAKSSDEIRYQFPDVMISDPAPEGTFVVSEGEKWITLRASAFALARIKRPFEIKYGSRVRKVEKGELIYISTGEHIFGCARRLRLQDSGERVPCFADLNKDGEFDAVRLKNLAPRFESYPGKVDIDDLDPIVSLPYQLIADRDTIVRLKNAMEWQIEHDGRTVSLCQTYYALKEYRYCLREKTRLRRTNDAQRIEYYGGIFWVQRLPNNQVSVRIEKTPDPIIF